MTSRPGCTNLESFAGDRGFTFVGVVLPLLAGDVLYMDDCLTRVGSRRVGSRSPEGTISPAAADSDDELARDGLPHAAIHARLSQVLTL